jgi:hypothetical protein
MVESERRISGVSFRLTNSSQEPEMNSTKKAARIAGLLYLLNGLPAPVSLVYIPSLLVVAGDASATAGKIRASEFLFRVGIVGQLISATIFIFAGLALYHLLKGINKKHALLMLILVLISVPISFLNELNRIAALMLVRGANFLSVFDQRQLDALAMAFLRSHGSGLLLAQIFWGLWLFPFGVLVFKSGFLPRILGVLLIVAGTSYVTSSFTSLLFPAYGHEVFMMAGFLGGIGECSTI